MSFLHAFLTLLALMAGFDLLVFEIQKAPKRAVLGTQFWVLGFLAGVFELGWWFFQ